MENQMLKNNSHPNIWKFILYMNGLSQAGHRAESILRRLCDHYLPGHYSIMIVDILENPADIPQNVIAVPTVVRAYPFPERRVIGDLSVTESAIVGLGLDETHMPGIL